MTSLYASISGMSQITDVSVNTNHGAATSQAIISCITNTRNLGDYIEVDLGYDTEHDVIFSGYIKNIERVAPDDVYKITAQDVLVRAVDYFIAASNPDEPFKRNNIKAEKLVKAILKLADPNYTIQSSNTYFTFGVEHPVEVNLVSSYDYANMIAGLLAWEIWAEEDGTIQFRNRKPYVMDGTTGTGAGQPGYAVDTPINDGDPITVYASGYSSLLDDAYGISEKDVRNKVVVYGATGVYAEASKATTFNPLTGSFEQILPSNFYKAAVAATEIIDTVEMAQNSADYNLATFNRLQVSLSCNTLGKPTLLARRVIEINDAVLGINGDFYIYSAEHAWNQQGYTVNMELRK